MAKAENRARGGSRDAAGDVDLGERGSHSEYSLGIAETPDSGCLAFVRVGNEGWLEVTCPAPGHRRCVTFERRKIRVVAPAGCHLLRDLRDAEAR
jgi:hypothetical protein